MVLIQLAVRLKIKCNAWESVTLKCNSELMIIIDVTNTRMNLINPEHIHTKRLDIYSHKYIMHIRIHIYTQVQVTYS